MRGAVEGIKPILVHIRAFSVNNALIPAEAGLDLAGGTCLDGPPAHSEARSHTWTTEWPNPRATAHA
jgi:hypothetical protein